VRHFDYIGKGIPYDRKKIVQLIREEGAQAKQQGKSRQSNPYDDMDQYQWWVGYDDEPSPSTYDPEPTLKERIERIEDFLERQYGNGILS
jgi:ribosome modulation factor